MSKKIKKALGDVVLIEELEMEQKTEAGILLSDNIMRLQKAKIIMLDEENQKVKDTGIKVGDTVLLYKSSIIRDNIVFDMAASEITYTVAGNIKFIVNE